MPIIVQEQSDLVERDILINFSYFTRFRNGTSDKLISLTVLSLSRFEKILRMLGFDGIPKDKELVVLLFLLSFL